MKVVKELDILDIEEAIHDLAGIAVLVESVGHRIATVGSSKSDENAFNQIAELILQKQEIFEKFFNDYKHTEQTKGSNNE
jgi:hypothetical protein